MSDFARLMELARDVSLPPTCIDVPHVSGDAQVGAALACTKGNWDHEPDSYAYQWRSDGSAVGLGESAYTVAPEDAGHAIDCVVTATNLAGSTTASPSNSISIPAARSKT